MRIGLTGGLGCGVSEVARHLADRGVPVISADEIGHQLLLLPEIKKELLNAFGASIFTRAGEIDREALGQMVFSEAEARKKLNAIIHPPLLEELTAQARDLEAQYGVVVVDAALIYEWGIAGFFHQVIVVSAPLELRLERLMTRDGRTREEVLQRIANQMPLEEKVAKAAVIVQNTGTLEEAFAQVDGIWKDLMKLEN